MSLLDEIPDKHQTEWPPFPQEEFLSALLKCSNDLTPGSDKLSWRYLKEITRDLDYLDKFIDIANVYFELGY